MELFGPGKKRFVKALGDLVREWKDLGGGGFTIKLNDELIPELHVMHVPVSFSLDVKTIMTAPITLIPKGEMNEKGRKIYQIMKGMECILEYEGFISKKPIFRVRPDLNSLNKYLGGCLSISSSLADRLNSDTKLLSLLKSVKPSDLKILLKSFDIPTFMPGDRVGMLMAEAEYYSDPSELTWIISLTTLIPVTIFFRRNILRNLEILRAVAYHVRNLYEEIIKEIK